MSGRNDAPDVGNARAGNAARPSSSRHYEVVDGRPHLIGTRCSACGAAFFPPRHVCPNCLTDESMERWRFGNIGRLYAHTVIHIASPEFNPPYPFGYLVLEPENVRIPAMITGVEDRFPLRTGMKMEMVLDKLRDDGAGGEVVTYKFRPLADRQS